MRFFRYDSSFWSVTARVFDLMLLNFLWFLTSIPLVTIGASTTALAAVNLGFARGENPPVVATFFSVFCRQFVRATGLWLSVAGAAAWLLLGVYACSSLAVPLLRMAVIPECMLLFAVAITGPYLFPLCCETTLSFGKLWMKAAYVSMVCLPWSCLLILVAVIPLISLLYLQMWLPFLLFFWIFFGVGGIGHLQGFILNRIFQRYVYPQGCS